MDVEVSKQEIRGSVWHYECLIDDYGMEKCEGKQTRTVTYEGQRMEYISLTS